MTIAGCFLKFIANCAISPPRSAPQPHELWSLMPSFQLDGFVCNETTLLLLTGPTTALFSYLGPRARMHISVRILTRFPFHDYQFPPPLQALASFTPLSGGAESHFVITLLGRRNSVWDLDLFRVGCHAS